MYHGDRTADSELQLCRCPALREGTIAHTTSPRKDRNSNFEVQLLLNGYHFCSIIESKNQTILSRGPSTLCLTMMVAVTFHMALPPGSRPHQAATQ